MKYGYVGADHHSAIVKVAIVGWHNQERTVLGDRGPFEEMRVRLFDLFDSHSDVTHGFLLSDGPVPSPDAILALADQIGLVENGAVCHLPAGIIGLVVRTPEGDLDNLDA